MKVFIVFPSSSSPFQVEAETYTREHDFIHFHAAGQIVKSVRADGLLTIMEQRGELEQIERHPEQGQRPSA